MRKFKVGDIVDVSLEELNSLKYVPNYPQTITTTTGTVRYTRKLWRSEEVDLVVQLDACPDIPNLVFHSKDVTLLVPVELDTRVKALEKVLKAIESYIDGGYEEPAPEYNFWDDRTH